MGSTPNVPSLNASADTTPYTFVKITGNFTAAKCTVATDLPIGVTDGSVYQYDSTYNALSGNQLSLQPGDIVQVQCAGNISAGALVQPDGNGYAVTASTTNGNRFAGQQYVALQDGTSGAIIWIMRTGAGATYPA